MGLAAETPSEAPAPSGDGPMAPAPEAARESNGGDGWLHRGTRGRWPWDAQCPEVTLVVIVLMLDHLDIWVLRADRFNGCRKVEMVV